MAEPEEPQTLKGWRELSRRELADCRVFTVEERRFQHLGDGKEADFYVLRPGGWAVSLARLSDRRWLVIRQFRYGRGEHGWEFPSGCAEEGEDAFTSASRELREETGYRGLDPVLLGKVAPNPALQDNLCSFIFFQKVEFEGAPQLDEHEDIEVAFWSDAELRRATRDGRMSHALMLTALYLYDAWEAERAAP
jgi:8-oxo-dGTP pyrophosphatase MutT (NUDIX family)